MSERDAIDFDHNSRSHAQNWTTEYREMREQHPRAWTDTHGGYWIATKYKDIIRIAQRPDDFSTHKNFDRVTGEATGGASIPTIPVFRAVPNESEAPEWNNVRQFLNRRFAPQAIEAYRAKAKEWAAALIDLVIEKGRFDIVDDLANPLPALIAMEIFGFPMDEWREFADLFHKINYLPGNVPEHHAAMDKLDYFLRHRVDEEVALRRKTPRDDLFGFIALGKIDGEPLSRDLIHNMAFNLVGGGVGTTAALTSHTLLHLSRTPADRQRLIDEPDLMPVATEEFLRYFSVIHGNARNIKNDVDIDGWHLRAGERVLLAFASANRDPDVFDEPEKLKLDRFPNRHIGFGAGTHRCLGSFLARMLFQVSINEVLTRIPDYKVDETDIELFPSIAITNGWIRMPATFTPGKKVGARLPGA